MAFLRWAGLWLVVLGALLSPRLIERHDPSLWEVRQALAQEATPTSELPANPTPDFVMPTESATAEATPTGGATATETATEVATPEITTETVEASPTDTPAESTTPSPETETPTATETPSVTPTPSPTATSTAVVEVIIGPDGGSVTTYDGNATLTFPAGATNEPLKVRVESTDPASAPALHQSSLLNTWKFDAYAIDRAWAPVHQFQTSISVDLSYESDEMFGRNEGMIRYWFVDESTGDWVEQPVEAVGDHQWRVSIDHFSTQASSSDDLINLPPILDQSQVDLNSGAATFSYPIDVVPGVGKVTPNIGLSYSSARVDETTKKDIAPSWVGLGAELSMPAITKQANGTGAAYFLNMDGVGGELIQDGASGYWYLRDHKFIEVTHFGSGCESTPDSTQSEAAEIQADTDNCKWQVRDQEGRTWLFGANAQSRRYYVRTTGDIVQLYHGLALYQWDLTSVTDLHGNSATYSYSQIRGYGAGVISSQSWQWGIVASYPSSVTYPGGSVAFTLRPETTTSGLWDASGNPVNVRPDAAACVTGFTREVRALDSITVKARDGATDQPVRSYAFGYGYDAACSGTINNWSLTDFRLTSIAALGLTGTTALTTTTLEYEARTTRLDTSPGMFCALGTGSFEKSRTAKLPKLIKNGLGGEVEFGYTEMFSCDGDQFGRNAPTSLIRRGGSAWTSGVAPNVTSTISYGGVPVWVNGAYRGFKDVTVADAVGNSVKHTYALGNESHSVLPHAADLAGRELSTKWFATGGGTALMTTDYTYTSSAPSGFPTPARWNHLDAVTTTTTDGGVTTVAKTSYGYDSTTGRTTTVDEDGDPTSSSNVDCRRTTSTYYAAPTGLTVIAPESISVGSCNGGTTTRTDYFYDGALGGPLPSSSAGRANLTLVRQKASTTSGSQQYVWLASSYYSNGNPKEQAVPIYGDATHSGTSLSNGVDGTVWANTGSTLTTYESDSGHRLVATQTVYVYEGSVLSSTQTTNYAYTDSSGSNARRLGKPASITAPNGHITQFTYDDFGRRVSTWQSLDGTNLPGTEYAYDWSGSTTNGVNNTVVKHRWTATQTTATEVGRTCYDGLGRAMQTVSPFGDLSNYKRTQTILDARGLAINSRVWAGSSGCDGAATGQASSPNRYVEYDALGRAVTSTSSAAGAPSACVPRCVRTKYVGRSTKVTDAEGHRKETIVDGLGRVIETIESTGTSLTGDDTAFATYVRTKYEYDGMDNLIRVNQNWNGTSSAHKTEMTYDLLGRRLTLKDPDMSGASGLMTTSVYDAAGNLVQQTDPRGEQVISTYDSLNRLRTKKYGSTPAGVYEASYVYDVYEPSGFCSDLPSDHAIGQLVRSVFRVYGTQHYGTANPQTVIDGNSRSCYDVRGREIRRQQVVPNPECATGATERSLRMDRTYDAADRVTALTYPDNDSTPADDREVLSYGYDDTTAGAGVLRSINTSLAPSTPYVSNVTYSAALGTASVTFGSGFTTTYEPDDRNRLRRIRTASTATTAQDLNIEYFEDGNIKRVRDDSVSPVDDVTYGYDDLGRLISMAGSATASYAYTGVDGKLGNLKVKTEGGVGGLLTYGDDQHVHAPKAYNGKTYTYDAAGNMLQRKSGTFAEYDFYFNAESRLTRLDDNNGFDINSSYAYDAAGSRVRLQRHSIDWAFAVTANTAHFMDGIYEDSAVGCGLPNMRTNYIQAFGRTIAQRVTTGSSNVTYLLADHLGSTVGSISSTGGVTTNKYYPYGAPRVSGPPSSIAFTGQRRENTLTGAFDPYYYGARFYSTELGHFLSPDPLTVDGYNRYQYVRGNPLRYTDPTGLCGEEMNILWDSCTLEKANYVPGDLTPVVAGCSAACKAAANAQQAVVDGMRAGAAIAGALAAAEISAEEARLAAIEASDGLQALGSASRATGMTPDDWLVLAGASIPLRLMHSVETLSPANLAYWRGRPTDEIIKSLAPESGTHLQVKPNGTVVDGNTRITVLKERGINVDALPRTIYRGPTMPIEPATFNQGPGSPKLQEQILDCLENFGEGDVPGC